jgi:hypothetical protein
MAGNRMLPHLAGALLLAVAIYTGGFWLDQTLRTRRGPWTVEFGSAGGGAPALRIDQPALGIREVRVVFVGETAAPTSAVVRFDAPERPVPWGRVKYEDLTYLPGVVTLELFGHELELLPRTLYVNRQPVGWISRTNLTLTAADRPAALPEPVVGRGRRSTRESAAR